MSDLKPLQPISLVSFLLMFSVAAQLVAGSAGLKYESVNETNRIDQSEQILEDGMYVILGAFKIAANARQYAQSVKIDGKNPLVGKYELKNLYYVYAYKSTEDLEFVRAKRSELRATSQFFDTWILYVGISLEELLSKAADEAAAVALVEPAEIQIVEPEQETSILPDTTVENIPKIQFIVVDAANKKELSTEIAILDTESKETIKTVSSNEAHEILFAESNATQVIAQCEVFGFEKEEVVVNIDDPMSSPDQTKISQNDGVTTITFALSRPTKIGEVLTLYNVYFYTDAAILKPQSELELDKLLSMMQENNAIRIRIHGHTNGNASGKIISLKEDDVNYFEITENNVYGFGTARELSRRRAELIQKWLVNNGIDQSRMEIKAWGGKKMIYKRNDTRAEGNVRVEIELLNI